jgi:phosphatidylglycerophosphate synthase
MFDISLRPLAGRVIDPLASRIPTFITPNLITCLGFCSGLLSCYCTRRNASTSALIYWFLNRLLDSLDGALARHRRISSARGGFLDLLCDFIIYSLIPLSISLRGPSTIPNELVAVAVLEISFHVNNFVLFYSAAVAADRDAEELTSVTMRPALIEGFESGLIFTVMLAKPGWLEVLSWGMAVAVFLGVVQRSVEVWFALGRAEEKRN